MAWQFGVILFADTWKRTEYLDIGTFERFALTNSHIKILSIILGAGCNQSMVFKENQVNLRYERYLGGLASDNQFAYNKFVSNRFWE